MPKTIAACVPVSHAPPAITARNVPAQMTPISASPRILRLPSTSLTIGSCASATTPEKTNQMTPIAGSLTCAVFLNTTLRKTYERKVRLRSTFA